MRIYIHTDIEGVAGWVFYANLTSNTYQNVLHTQRMNQLLTNEVVSACRAAIDAGADEVFVNDAHGLAYNIFFEQLPSRCQIIHGRGGHFDHWLSGLDEKTDALVCVGQHAMAGTPNAVCPHSLWYVNNTIRLSETTMAAAMAGSFGVPMVCVTGDDKICAECAEKIPNIEQVIVKRGIAAQNARSLCPADANERIYQGVLCGIKRRKKILPYVIPGPYQINLSDRDPNIRQLPQDVTGDDLIETTHRLLNQVFAHFGQDTIDDRSFRFPA